MELSGAQKRKRAWESLKRHYLEKVLASPFRDVEKRCKTHGKHAFSKCKIEHRKTFENLAQIDDFELKSGISQFS